MKVHKSIRLQLNHCKVKQKRAYTPVLYTVVRKSTFWKMNPSVWVVLAAQGSNEEFLKVVFSIFCGQKNVNIKKKHFFAHKKLKKTPKKVA